MEGFVNAQEEGREGEGSRAQEQVGAEEPRTAEAPPPARWGARRPLPAAGRDAVPARPVGQPARAAEGEAPSRRRGRQGAARAGYGRGDGRAGPALEQARSDGEADCRRRDERRPAGDQAPIRAHQGRRTGAERARRRAPGRARERGGRDRDRRASPAVCGGRAFAHAAFGPGPSPRNRGEANPSLSGEGSGREPAG